MRVCDCSLPSAFPSSMQKREPEMSPFPGFRFHPDLPPMPLDDLPTDGQSDARALVTRGRPYNDDFVGQIQVQGSSPVWSEQRRSPREKPRSAAQAKGCQDLFTENPGSDLRTRRAYEKAPSYGKEPFPATYSLTTLIALGPFGLSSVSKLTLSPSARLL